MNVITHTLRPTLLAAPLLPRANPREYGVSAGVVALGAFWWWPAYRRNRAAPVANRETLP